MLLKCNYCDPVVKRGSGEEQRKSIDTDVDDFVKEINGTHKGKYFHVDCYRLHYKNRAKIKKTDDEIESSIIELKKVLAQEIVEKVAKDNFYQWIMEFYNASLSSYYCTKVQSIRDGSHNQVKESVTYETLLDIYKYMANYLNKVAASKSFDSINQRMNYDLGIVLGNLSDYYRWKERQKRSSVEEIQVDKQLKLDNKVQEIKEKQVNKEDEFDITDIIDDLLL